MEYSVNGIAGIIFQHQHCFISEDYNSHKRIWNCYTTTCIGRPLYTLITHYQLHLHTPSSPTNISTTARSYLSIMDFNITKNLPYTLTVIVLIELSSDQLPVSFKTNLNNPILHLSTSFFRY